jgi:hypothetical protein
MATAERSRPTAHHARDPELYNPLNQLRGTIRRYVLLEGAISVALFAAAWFALGLVLDFGFFKVTGVDWVFASHWFLRVFLLVVGLAVVTAAVEGFAAAGLFVAGALALGTLEYLLIAATGSGVWAEAAPSWFRMLTLLVVAVPLIGVIGYRLFRRLTTELSYPALALVLERKFPRLLGDRLITAIELGNVQQMVRYGYSEQMLLATIAEARERVAKVPVNEVFAWRRLWRMAGTAALLVAGTLAVGLVSHAAATRTVSRTGPGGSSRTSAASSWSGTSG